MNSISLRELISGTEGLPLQGSLCPEAFTLMLNAWGPLNAHLEIPVDPLSGRRDYYNRESALSLDEPVYGSFLLLTFHGHDAELVLTEHENLDEIKDEILGPVGSFNCWVDAQFAFRNLKPIPFAIRYTDNLGQRKLFNIEDRASRTQHREIEFEWLTEDAGR